MRSRQENGMAWRGVHFSVTGSIAAVFTDHFKIISGTGKYIRPDLYAARNCVCTDGTALVNVECTAECTSGCRRCEFYIVCVIDHNVADPQCDFYNAFSFRPVVKSKNSCMISCFFDFVFNFAAHKSGHYFSKSTF